MLILPVLGEQHQEDARPSAERRIGATDVIALVEAAIAEHRAPSLICSDNGPESIAKELQRWLAEQKIKTIYITPASLR